MLVFLAGWRPSVGSTKDELTVNVLVTLVGIVYRKLTRRCLTMDDYKVKIGGLVPPLTYARMVAIAFSRGIWVVPDD